MTGMSHTLRNLGVAVAAMVEVTASRGRMLVTGPEKAQTRGSVGMCDSVGHSGVVVRTELLLRSGWVLPFMN